MNSVTVEEWHHIYQSEVEKWLSTTFGPPSYTTWWFDVQPLMTDLVMNNEVFAMYTLKWGQ